MSPQQAEALLRAEVASDSQVGKALTALLLDSELQNYRQSSKTVDALVTAKIVGRGEGILSVLNRVTPVKDPALQGRENLNPAAGI